MNSYSSTEKPIRLRQRLKGETQATILAAAEEVFAEEGLAARMESIAARAGVAVGTVYNHFQDRDALFAALVQSRRATLLAALDAAMAESAPRGLEETLRSFLGALFRHWAQHARLLTMLVQAELLGKASRGPQAGPSCNILQEIERRAEQITRRGVAEQKLKPEGADLYPGLLAGMARGVLVREIRERPGVPVPDHSHRVAELFLRGAGR
jgi:AcrR family transcriptional regulator